MSARRYSVRSRGADPAISDADDDDDDERYSVDTLRGPIRAKGPPIEPEDNDLTKENPIDGM